MKIFDIQRWAGIVWAVRFRAVARPAKPCYGRSLRGTRVQGDFDLGR